MRFFRRRNKNLDEAKRDFAEFLRSSAQRAEAPVDVVGEPDDAALDDRVWLRVSGIVESGHPIGELDDDLRAYFATRSFEWELASGGITGFLDWHGREIAPYVAAGYRHLGLDDAATAFERLWGSPQLQAMLEDDEATDIDLELERLVEAVGSHDDVRQAFIRSHPASFST